MNKLLPFLERLHYFVTRLKEVGTWRMIAALLSMIGANVTDDQVELVLMLIAMSLVIWESFYPDASTVRKEQDAPEDEA